MRNAIAEIRQRQPLEHDIGQPAIGRRIACALLRDDQIVRGLVFAAAMNAHVEVRRIKRLAVSPDAADMADLTFAKPDREVRIIGIRRRGDAAAATCDPALAARAATLGARGDDFLQPRRPDHLARQPRAAIDPRDRRALSGGHDVEVRKARPLHRAVLREQGMVDDVADQRAGDPARDGAGRTEYRTRRAACD